MQTNTRHPEHRGATRLQELGAFVLLLVAIPPIASPGGVQGNDGGGEGNGGGGDEQTNGSGGDSMQGGNTRGGENKPPISSVRSVVASPNQESLDGDRARIRGAEVRNIVSSEPSS